MVRIIIVLLFCFPAVTFAQTYQQLSERAIPETGSDIKQPRTIRSSVPQAG